VNVCGYVIEFDGVPAILAGKMPLRDRRFPEFAMPPGAYGYVHHCERKSCPPGQRLEWADIPHHDACPCCAATTGNPR
jgi:hypothetical protein